MTRASIGIAAAGLLAMGGCGSPAKESGVRIGDETLRQFEAGVTTEAWILAILGEPTSESYVADLPNTKVFRYALVEESSGLISFFTGGSGKNKAVVYFLITDGVMTRFWADRDTEQPLIGDPNPVQGGQVQ